MSSTAESRISVVQKNNEKRTTLDWEIKQANRSRCALQEHQSPLSRSFE